MALTILTNQLLTNTFAPSLPVMIESDKLVFDFDLLIANVAGGVTASVEWYPEYCHPEDNPNVATARWFREVAEEDVGQGDVRMPISVRRFSTNGADNPLPVAATHYFFDVQLKRTHAFNRIQIRVAAGGADACRATVYVPFGVTPSA